MTGDYIRWAQKYIAVRYGMPSSNFRWSQHGWYAGGGVVRPSSQPVPNTSLPKPKITGTYGDGDSIHVPDATDYFVGWRGWVVQLDRAKKPPTFITWENRVEEGPEKPFPRIESPSYCSGIWEPDGPYQAKCVYYNQAKQIQSVTYRESPVEHGDAPGKGCTCGLYAAYPIKNCVASNHGRGFTVLGPVKAWGKVIPGNAGFRAQYMQPLAFLEPSAHIPHPSMQAVSVRASQVRFPHDALLFDLASLYNVPIIPSIAFKYLSEDRILELIREDIRDTGFLPGNGLRVVQQWLGRR